MNYIINTKEAPKPIGPYSQAIEINNFIILSGQIPIDVMSNHIPENIAEQTYLVLKNIKSILIHAKFQVSNIIKTTIFTTNLKKINIINEIYTKFFIDNKSEFPTRSCVEVQALPKNVKIEIEAIAFKK
ncbi:putative L-PSP (mRNA) endoribonuclease [Buchnera aphidicola str. Ak (Acyrthosiphon kondoi)]|uniref:Putative L-PSP (MRNA) endoribonuclease n=1 Tax=Buchnera aphidicola str. Ak (Acyrthosiphon kondoi) TaxID=1005090 RepID=G2LN79_9GAMM|nr:Rid family detoxifying hydrolase [Buchnera aphidicola]AEO08717.1 putative L-PSP (mRNA) endoribonuclease [Buchnera aphidicola str. Ak (Acyrthosiphon kondoi)]WAI18475.1 MAG: Rid family detoxifying hydrolase [Buchnera aphidicola (Acyrthosiphon caraganae)]